MRTIEIKLYKYSELSEEVKEKVINDHRDINVDIEWWDGVYLDAFEIGLKIRGFDIDRASYVDGELLYSVEKCCRLIKENHGVDCGTTKLADEYLSKIEKCEDEDDFEDEFIREICEEYLSILRDEYEYLTSDEAIADILVANEYEFTESGEVYN